MRHVAAGLLFRSRTTNTVTATFAMLCRAEKRARFARGAETCAAWRASTGILRNTCRSTTIHWSRSTSAGLQLACASLLVFARFSFATEGSHGSCGEPASNSHFQGSVCYSCWAVPGRYTATHLLAEHCSERSASDYSHTRQAGLRGCDTLAWAAGTWWHAWADVRKQSPADAGLHQPVAQQPHASGPHEQP